MFIRFGLCEVVKQHVKQNTGFVQKQITMQQFHDEYFMLLRHY